MTNKNQDSLFDVLGTPENNKKLEENLVNINVDWDALGCQASIVEPKNTNENTTKDTKDKKEEPPADKTRVVCYCGKSHVYEDRSLSLEDIRKDLQKRYYPELTKERTEMEYDTKKGLVFPRVKAAKKGRKHFMSVADMAKHQAPVVNILAAADGLYEIRKNEIGVFSARTNHVFDLDQWQSGFKPFLPKIPFNLLCQALAFIKSTRYECMLQIFWNRERKEYFIHCPEQEVTLASVDAKRDGPEREHLLVIDLHSHNSMKADFSSFDDKDELETRLYGIIGRTEYFLPHIRVRISVGGNHHEINPEEIFETPFDKYPVEWLEKVVERTVTII